VVPLAILIGALVTLLTGADAPSAGTPRGPSHTVAMPRAVLAQATVGSVIANAAHEYRLALHRDWLPPIRVSAPARDRPALTD
jgi:hypothetical protein